VKTDLIKVLAIDARIFYTIWHLPYNAIVGGSGDISVGAALYKKINRKSGN